MFLLNNILLRPVDLSDGDQMYQWHQDIELEIYSSWGPRQSRTTYDTKFRKFLEEPPNDLVVFAIEAYEQLVGRIELYTINRSDRNAGIGLLIGDKSKWGSGIGSLATQIMLDYAFNIENLEKVYAHVYSFNSRAIRLMRRVGMVEEGILRKHEYHNGQLRDVYAFGILKPEFYQRYTSLFAIPGSDTATASGA
ncbi:MAG: GNAT family protein [Acidobacteriota bacterium]